MGKNRKLDILWEDEELLIVNKPAKLLSIPDRFDQNKPNLYHLLLEEKQEAYIVHRLDFETSGAICFAKKEESLAHLSQQFENRTTSKTYVAVVTGRIFQDEGEIDKPIAPHPFTKGKMTVNPKGKTAQTKYQVTRRYKGHSLVEIELLTGRTHQIRVHFQAIGYPLAIDPLYNQKSELYLSEIKKKNYRLGKEKSEHPLISRTTLHAWKLGIQHPTTKEHILVEAPFPKDLKALINQLEKWSV